MSHIALQSTQLSKTFNQRLVFSNVSFGLKEGDSLAVTGRNGSGKSTLLKILAGVLTSTRGEIVMRLNGETVKHTEYFCWIGFVSPYLQLYDEFTGWEHLDIFRKVRGIDISDQYISELLNKVNLWDRRNDFVRIYSSGMKQRLKYAFALIHKPPILLLDEPNSNLDAEGISAVYEFMEDQKKHGILIVATNEAGDIQRCSHIVDLNTKQREGV